ncbi:ATPase AAA [Fibrobacterales bacterium]|nr:ATPase AAA [Fibrobacterales bacterium]
MVDATPMYLRLVLPLGFLEYVRAEKGKRRLSVNFYIAAMDKPKRYPLGIQTFSTIREDDYHYVDKTARIHELVSGSGYVFFLSRPRRFGKSLLCSTLGALFEGRRELFKYLAIDSLTWEWKKHPVIRIDLNVGDYAKGVEELYVVIDKMLESCANKYDVPFVGKTISDKFSRLIESLHNQCGEKVAVVIDEYDKPLLNTLDTKIVHEEIRNALKAFYGVLKSSDEHLKFVFLTGVTKFSKVSIFSDLNNLTDLSLDPRYADICGITQEELEENFKEEIDSIAGGEGGAYLAKLKRFYNGYRFSEKPLTVYNPFGLLHHFNSEGKFIPYWYESGTPTFLIKLIKQQNINVLNLEQKVLSYDDFRKFDVENMDAVPVLYQSGYLTITGYNEKRGTYNLGYPNDEVRTSFASSLADLYIHIKNDEKTPLVLKLIDSLEAGEVDNFVEALRPFYNNIPYDEASKVESYYELIFLLTLRMLGIYCEAQVHTAIGRIDAVLKVDDFVYVVELKVNGTAEEALAQINDKNYALSYEGQGKKIVKLGIEFDKEKRNIGRWVIGNV